MSDQAKKPLTRKTAIITGAAGGLGRAISRTLASKGWHIAICDLNAAESLETLRQVEAAGGSGQIEPLDITNEEAWQTLVDRLRTEWPQLDLLINNAGVCCAGEVGALPLADWRWICDVNLMGAVYGCHTCVEWLKANPRGAHLVNVASIAAVAAMPAMAAYNATKAAVLSLSETLYAELLPHNVSVTVVAPGIFQTRLLDTGRFALPTHRDSAVRMMSKSRTSADKLAAVIVRGIERRHLYVVSPLGARMIWRCNRYVPQLFLRLLSFVYRRENARLAKAGA